MTQGYLVLAQGGYARLAEKLAASIKETQSKINNISIITDEVVDKNLFDKVINIPENDLSIGEQWKIHNRVYFYDLTPYDETVILDADMLFLTDVSHWWDLFKFYELLVTDKVKTYRDQTVTNSPYRKTFRANNLPDLYSAFTYFKKCETSKVFFNLVKSIIKNWDEYIMRYAPEYKQRFPSIDLAFALSARILGIEDKIISPFEFPTFAHMKTGCQGWRSVSSYEKWSDAVGLYKTQNGIKIGGYLQHGILHYVEKDLL
jgi:hypothetical protein